jgi:hypothetical protein
MATFYRGAGIGTYWHQHDALAQGFVAKGPGAAQSNDRLMMHISRGAINSPYISLTRSYCTAIRRLRHELGVT